MTYHHELVTNTRYIYGNVLDEKYIKVALQLTDNNMVQVYINVYVYMCIYCKCLYLHTSM